MTPKDFVKWLNFYKKQVEEEEAQFGVIKSSDLIDNIIRKAEQLDSVFIDDNIFQIRLKELEKQKKDEIVPPWKKKWAYDFGPISVSSWSVENLPNGDFEVKYDETDNSGK